MTVEPATSAVATEESPVVDNYRGQIVISKTLPDQDRLEVEPPARETFRGIISLILLGIMTADLAFCGGAIVQNWMSFDQAKELLGFTLGPLVGLFGPICGFYFSSTR